MDTEQRLILKDCRGSEKKWYTDSGQFYRVSNTGTLYKQILCKIYVLQKANFVMLWSISGGSAGEIRDWSVLVVKGLCSGMFCTWRQVRRSSCHSNITHSSWPYTARRLALFYQQKQWVCLFECCWSDLFVLLPFGTPQFFRRALLSHPTCERLARCFRRCRSVPARFPSAPAGLYGSTWFGSSQTKTDKG